MNYFRAGNLKKYLRTHDDQTSYAMITGTSDGLGTALASVLAASSLKLIIHGRNPTRPPSATPSSKIILRQEIQTVIADASLTTAAVIEDLVKPISSLPITILIYNIGSPAPAPPTSKPSLYTHPPRSIIGLILTSDFRTC